MVKKGQGQAALRLSVVGSALGLGIGLLVVLALLTFGNALGALEALLRPWLFFVLAGVSAVLIISDRPRGWSLFTFLASGLLGLAVFASPLIAGGTDAAVNAFFPALAGLFGVAGLLFAISTAGATSMPDAGTQPAAIDARRTIWPGVRGGVAGLLVGLLPGLGAANAATLLLLLEKWFGRRKSEDEQDRAYLVTTSSLNTAEALFAIAALYLIGRSRSGASIAVEQVLGGRIGAGDLLWIVLFMTGAGIAASLLLWRVGPRFASGMGKVDSTALNWSVVAFLTVLTYALLGLGGLAILVAATAVGSVPLYFGVRRAQLMGFFLVPAMLFFSGQQGQLIDWLSLGQRTAPLLPSITLTGIAVASAAAFGAGGAVYLLAGAARSARWAHRLPTVAAPLARGGGLATYLVGALVLVVALLGGAYPLESRMGARGDGARGRRSGTHHPGGGRRHSGCRLHVPALSHPAQGRRCGRAPQPRWTAGARLGDRETGWTTDHLAGGGRGPLRPLRGERAPGRRHVRQRGGHPRGLRPREHRLPARGPGAVPAVGAGGA